MTDKSQIRSGRDRLDEVVSEGTKPMEIKGHPGGTHFADFSGDGSKLATVDIEAP